MVRALPALLAGALLLPAWAAAQEGSPGPVGPPAPAAPRLKIEEKALSFGEIPRGKTVDLTFYLENVGQAPLEISKVLPTCGCTVPRFPRQIPPGVRAPLVVTFDSRTRHYGKQSYRIDVYSNDDTQADKGKGCTVLSVSGTVLEVFRNVPPAAGFGVVVRGSEPVRRKVVVHGIVAELAQGFQAELQPEVPEFLTARVEPLPAEEGQPPRVEVEVTLLPGAPLGALFRELRFKTDNPAHPMFAVPITAQVTERYAFATSTLFFEAVPRGQSSLRSLSFQRRGPGEGPLPILRIDCDPELLHVRHQVLNDAQANFTVAIQPTAPAGPIATHVTVLLDDPLQPVARLPVLAWVRPGVSLQPEALLLPEAVPAGELLGRVEVFADSPRAKLVQGARLEPADALPVDVQLIPQEGPGPSHVIELRAREALPGPSGWPGGVRLVLVTGVAGEERQEVPLFAR